MAAWSLVSEKYFKAIHIKELYFKQGECELEDLTHLLARNLLKAKMFVNLFKIALNPVSWKHEKCFPNLCAELYRVVEDWSVFLLSIFFWLRGAMLVHLFFPKMWVFIKNTWYSR